MNPYGGNIELSQLILQLSGSRGSFELGLSINELLGFTMRLTPSLLFEATVGTKFYQYYCTASVYIFSRIPERLTWYKKEIISIAQLAFLYHFILIFSCIFTAIIRCDIIMDKLGALLFVYHLAIFSMWTMAFSICVNLLSIKLGSSSAYLILSCVQVILISLFVTLNSIKDDHFLLSKLIRLNPVACLVLGWQKFRFPLVNSTILSSYEGLYLEDSLFFVFAGCIVIIILGAIIVMKHDLLISDEDVGG